MVPAEGIAEGIEAEIHQDADRKAGAFFQVRSILKALRKELLGLLAPFGDTRARAAIYFSAALALALIYLYQGQRVFFASRMAPSLMPGAAAAEIELWGVFYQFACTFLLFFLVPALLLKFTGRERLADLGLGPGDVRFGLVVAILGLALIALPGGFLAGCVDDFRAEYPLARMSTDSASMFVLYQLAYGLLYYLAWEAFFRGFVQMGLRPHIGDLGAIMVQTAFSTLVHIGKPNAEIWAAMLAGFVFGALMLRLRSIWSLVLVHWGLGLFTDIFCARAAGML